MAAIIDYIPFDGTLIQNFRAMFKEFISDNLSTLGFVKASDVGQVDWTKVVSYNNLPRLAVRPQDVAWAFKGTWVAQTVANAGNYIGNTADTNANGNDLVTHSDGITYQCVNTTQATLTAATVNTAQSATITGVSVSGTTTTYTCSSVPAGLAGFAMTVTGCANSNNNGTFIVLTSTLNTSFTTTTIKHVTETVAASGSTSASNTTFTYTTPTGGTAGTGNAWTSLVWNVAGYTGGETANNGTNLVCLASTATQIALVIAGHTNATTVAGALNVASAPPNDLYDLLGSSNLGTAGHWQPYHFEVWKTNDGLQPVYFRFVYGITQTTGLPWIAFTAGNATNGMGFILNSCTSTNRMGTAAPGITNVGALNLTNDANTSDAYMHAVTSSTVATNLGFTNSQALYESTISGSGAEGWFTICLWRDSDILAASAALTAHTVFAFERARTLQGAPSDEYWSMWISGTGGNVSQLGTAGGSAFFQTVWKTGGSSARTLATAHPSALGAATVLFNGESPLFPLLPLARGYLGNPMTTVAAAPRTDFSIEGQLVTGSSYGTVHTYMILQSALGTGGGFGNVVANYNLALRFD